MAEKHEDPQLLEHYVRKRITEEIEANGRGYRQRIAKATHIADAQLTEWVKGRGLPGMLSIRRLARLWWHTTVAALEAEAERLGAKDATKEQKWRHPQLSEALTAVAHAAGTPDEVRRADAALPLSVRLTPDQAREMVLNLDRDVRAKADGSGVQESLPVRLGKRQGRRRKSR